MDKCLFKVNHGHSWRKETNNEENSLKLLKLWKSYLQVSPNGKTKIGAKIHSDRIGMKMDSVVSVGIECLPGLVVEAEQILFRKRRSTKEPNTAGSWIWITLTTIPCFLMIIDKGILYIYGMAKGQ